MELNRSRRTIYLEDSENSKQLGCLLWPPGEDRSMATHPSHNNDDRFPPAPRDEDVALVVLESESFTQFDQWMDADLERLVARWIHTAAPNANRVALLRGRSLSK